MKRLLRRFTPLLIAPLAAVLASPQVAYAHPGAGVGVGAGGGGIIPGLTTTPGPQSVSFTGTVTGLFDVLSLSTPDPTHLNVGTLNCGLTASGTASVISGSGNGSLTCSGPTTHITDTVGSGTASASCAVNLAQTGPVVVVTANCSITFTSVSPPRPATSVNNLTVVAGCVFEPTTAPGQPVTGFTAQCVVGGAGAA